MQMMNPTDHITDNLCGELVGLMGKRRPITIDEACDLRYLLFGNLKDSFSKAWLEQSFHFRSVPPYGFYQKRPGPCGVLAAVQAYVLKELLFGVSHINVDSGISKITMNQKNESLARALTTILWQAGDNNGVIVVKKNQNIVLNASTTSNILEPDGILEYLQLMYFECQTCLLEYYINFINEMTTDNNPSVIFFLFSVIMTHGFEKFKEEMDCKDNHLIGTDGYCSQEVVNLMLTGKAVTNLFDGEIEMNEGGSDTILLKGLSQQSKIGLLSLYDYQGNCTIGNNYKNPAVPIWILLADNHFTVLFALSCNILKKKYSKDSFILYHYNGLSRIHAETPFTINPAANTSTPPKDKILPAVECCILTRWTHAAVEPYTQEQDSSE